MWTADPDSPAFQKLIQEYWYYALEYAPGRFTHSELHPNIIATRDLLSRIDVSGTKCVDIGCMEGLVSMLLKRRGAANVVAIDALDFTDKINLVRNLYGVDFEYHSRIALHEAQRFLRDRELFGGFLGLNAPQLGYDVAILSGVLYHVFSPLHTLGLTRTLLRPGGVLVFETAASVRDEYALRWNFDGAKWIYPNGTNTWFITLKLLDHFLRFLRLKPIDVNHVTRYEDITRVGVTAVAVDEPLALPSEAQWFDATTKNFDYSHFVDLEYAVGRANVNVAVDPERLVYHPGTDWVDIHSTVMERAELPYDENRIRFRLTDQS